MHVDFETLAIIPKTMRSRRLHIVGGGSLGARCFMNAYCCGIEDIVIWDHDIVEPHNRLNQGFVDADAQQKRPKVDALVARARALIPESPTRIDARDRKVGPTERLDGIVMMCVDSMQEREAVLAAAIAAGSGVDLLIDGRTGPYMGKVFGLDPGNEHHVQRFTQPPHMHPDPVHMLPGCKGETPMPFIADIIAGHMCARLAEWLQLEQGAANPYMNFYGFAFKPSYAEAREYWDEDGTMDV